MRKPRIEIRVLCVLQKAKIIENRSIWIKLSRNEWERTDVGREKWTVFWGHGFLQYGNDKDKFFRDELYKTLKRLWSAWTILSFALTIVGKAIVQISSLTIPYSMEKTLGCSSGLYSILENLWSAWSTLSFVFTIMEKNVFYENRYTQVNHSKNRIPSDLIGSVLDSNRNPMRSDGNFINRRNPIGFRVEIRHLDP